MSNEHTGRKQLYGLGIEATAGSEQAVDIWLPKMDGEFKPVSEKAVDESAYGNIDKVFDQQTTKNMVEMSLEGMVRHEAMGYLLLGLMSTETVCHYMSVTSITGTFVVGETITGAGGATGTLKRIELGAGATGILYVEAATGTFAASENITGAGGATAAMTYDVLVAAHIFEIQNDNNNKTFTLYSNDDVAGLKSTYGMLDSLDVDIAVGAFAKFNCLFKGQKAAADAVSTPSFADEYPFLAKHATLKLADTVATLYVATATPVSNMKLGFKKNVIDYQAWGDDDVASFHNQDFEVTGDLEALFNSETIRNYMINSTKKAMLIEVTNDDETIGTTGNPIFKFELARASFMDWGNKAGNGELVKQRSGFMGEFSVDDAYTALSILVNDKLTAYT